MGNSLALQGRHIISNHPNKHCDGNNCEALCLINDDWNFCEEVCESYTCETIKTYRGNCDFTAGCEPVDEECVEIGQRDFEFPLGDCEPNDGSWYYKETNCWEGTYPGGTYPMTLCRNVNPQTGERFQLVDEEEGNTLYCDSVGSMNYGDPWCPVNYVYEDGFCIKQTAICDQGFEGNLMYGCDNLYTPDDDLFFYEYQKECVFKSSSAPPSIDVYDEICCYSSVFNGFQLYEKDRSEEYIKIY